MIYNMGSFWLGSAYDSPRPSSAAAARWITFLAVPPSESGEVHAAGMIEGNRAERRRISLWQLS
jgi:hypothetical protein